MKKELQRSLRIEIAIQMPGHLQNLRCHTKPLCGYATIKQKIKEFQCNVSLDGLNIGDYTTDFVCTLENGDLMVRKCVARSHMTKPMTVKLLDYSRNYWLNHGVSDWGLLIHAEK